jgi:serine/threonine-protein kinase SRPK3
MAQVMELLGEMPRNLALSGKYSHEMFNRRGELRHISRLRFWPIMSVLKEKYLMEHSEAELLASFLLPMLHYYPDSRATAAELVKHPWLEGVVVLGEMEIAEQGRRTALEQAKRSMGSGTSTPSKKDAATPSPAKGKGKEAKSALEEVLGLGPQVKGLAGMGRI